MNMKYKNNLFLFHIHKSNHIINLTAKQNYEECKFLYISQKSETVNLRDISFFLSSTIINLLILIKKIPGMLTSRRRTFFVK